MNDVRKKWVLNIIILSNAAQPHSTHEPTSILHISTFPPLEVVSLYLQHQLDATEAAQTKRLLITKRQKPFERNKRGFVQNGGKLSIFFSISSSASILVLNVDFVWMMVLLYVALAFGQHTHQTYIRQTCFKQLILSIIFRFGRHKNRYYRWKLNIIIFRITIIIHSIREMWDVQLVLGGSGKVIFRTIILIGSI